MNREILFRAKHIHAMDSNEHLDRTWVHGYLSDENYIYDKSLEGEFPVNENTICQYTGLTDKNGKSELAWALWKCFHAIVIALAFLWAWF